MQFAIQEEPEINFFSDIAIKIRKYIKLSKNRKTTATDTTPEHKLAGIKYFTNRLLTYPTKDSAK
jgi:hypothetical protein